LRKQAFSLEKEGKNADAKKIFNFISFNNQRISLAEINDEKKDIKFDSLKILRLYSNVYDYEDYKPPFPSEELDNFLNILMNAKKYPRSINIFISGRPGTGKSTFVKFLSSQLNKPILSLRASNLISSYLGDTQRNIDFLFEDILNVGDNGIILIDELDSILGSRNNEINDEYKRMIGSFNMLFDDIPRGTIIIGITNNPSSIDKAILRRFNIKLELDLIDLEDFISLFSSKSREFDLEFNAKLAKKIISELTPDNENPESLITYS
jgi:SpoVK/Ycf46/Vps4 family AAA+-type ATPase